MESRMGRSWHGRGGMKHRIDYVEDTPEHAQAAAMFALNPRAVTRSARLDVSLFAMRTHTMWVAAPG